MNNSQKIIVEKEPTFQPILNLIHHFKNHPTLHQPLSYPANCVDIIDQFSFLSNFPMYRQSIYDCY